MNRDADILPAPDFIIEQEDATRYLPHSPVGIEYVHHVYHGTERHIITGREQRRLIFTGTKAECEAFVASQQAPRAA